MTYVFITSTNAWGGIERKLNMLLNKFCERGHCVHLLLIRGGVVPYPDDLNPKIEVTHIKKTLGDLFLKSHLRRFIGKIDRPILILFKLGDAHVLADIRKKTPTLPVYFVISSTLKKGLNGNQRRLKKLTATLSRMSKIICVSHGVRQHIISNYSINSEKVEVLYNPLINNLEQLEIKDCDHPWLVLEKPTIPTFISAGRLVEAKDYQNLIHAVSIVREIMDCRLIILGEGVMRPQLESLIQKLGLEDCISLPGFVENPINYIRRASVFVLSSKNEGLANILVEALLSGTQVVSTDCPNGPREILLDGKLGILVQPRDSDALARAMLATLSTPAPCPELVAESLKRFDADFVADQYLQLIQKTESATTRC